MLALLLQLQARGQLSGSELSERLEVSERTVQRDVEALVAEGVPIRSTRGPGGGYYLEGRYQTRLTGVGADEAHALAFLGLAGPADDLGLTGLLDTARTKVWAALTGEARDRVERTAQRFHLDPVRWYGTTEPTPQLATLSAAVWEDRRIRVAYRSDDGMDRTLDPLGLVLASGDWHLVALRDQQLKTYRVSRFTRVEVLDEATRRPSSFVLAERWADARRDLETRHNLIEVTLRVLAVALPNLRRVVAAVGQSRIELNPTSEWIEVTVPFDSESWAFTTLLGLGTQVAVLAPSSLRARMAAETKRMAVIYQVATSERTSANSFSIADRAWSSTRSYRW
ncbi:MAG: putative DNA-binding transcriptional regulator YafY, contains an and domain [Acidimicrobiaceae bacterium]|nr:putative DNA-binding transcriptional regulator YafY, contains an and domain [Acidimicrobiaceae bacterium]